MARRLLLFIVSLAGLAHAQPTGRAIEFHDASRGAYFLTADREEIARFDAAEGWARTGGEFAVYVDAGDAADLAPVCRFRPKAGTGADTPLYIANAEGCDAAKQYPGWVYEGIAFYAPQLQQDGCPSATTPVLRTYSDAGSSRYSSDATVHAKARARGLAEPGIAMCAALSDADVHADAVRLLRQATFGAVESEAQRVAAIGAEAWIDEQLAMPATLYPAYPWMPFNRLASCPDTTPPLGPDSYCARDNYTLFRVQLDFFRQALSAPDQLRQRVAFALSQIMVTSGVRNARAYPMRDYQQLLRDRAFGRFGELLRAVTVSPLMGEYLDMANNDKVDPASGTDPNENYAREVLQLFTVGTFLLNRDGSHKVDADGRPLFTYGESEIKGFARVFTGWTYPVAPGAQPRNHNPREFVGEMIPVEANHESGAKLLLRQTLAPAGMGAVRDLDFALANVVSHPNVGPFIGRQLIQRLVTSDPSPEYVGRVAAVFDDNGAGERGDLRAVVRAILLDPEARGARKIDPGYGKLSEPVLYMTSLARAAGARTDGVFLRAWSSQLGQSLFYAPSVFNYYPADYLVPGSGLPGPEFGALNSATANARLNFANNLIFAAEIAPDPTLDGAIGTVRDFSPYVALASDPDKLAGMLDRTLLAGTMPPPLRARIVSSLRALPAANALERARTALWLVVASPWFQVQR